MRTLLPELCRERAGDAALVEDLKLLSGQVERCRTILREMVAFGKAQLSQVPQQLSTQDFIHSCVERFQLLRPDAALTVNLEPETANLVLRVPPGLRHALINLLNNAVDASGSRNSNVVILEVSRDHAWLQLCVRDQGPGFGQSMAPTRLGHSRKQAGLGLGLALAEATAERLNGELVTDDTAQGAEVCLRLPMLAVAAP
jgi:two-component system sensor histidine kinase RegB